MCLLIAISQVVADAPLIVAGNRDEFYDRDALSVSVLREANPRVLGGRDLRAGGTWLAVNEHGVVAGLTNKPLGDNRNPTKRSRGEIPLLLAGQVSAAAAVEVLASTYAPGEFNPCWVLVGDRNGLYYVDMTGPEDTTVALLPPGVHILENKPLLDPSEKVARVRGLMGDVRTGSVDQIIDHLGAVLRDHTPSYVPDVKSETIERQTQISACCVHTESYGTRSAMLVSDPLSATDPPGIWVADGPPCTHAFSPVSFAVQPDGHPDG